LGEVFSVPVNHKLQDSIIRLSCSANFSQDIVETCGFVLLYVQWTTIL